MKDLFEENKIDWATIDDYQNEGTLSGLCMALAECDKLLNYILNSQNYQGRTIFEKISQARARFSDLNNLAKALEIKEDIFAEYDKEVSKDDIKKAIKYYRQAILDLAETNRPDLGLGEKIKSWLNYYLTYHPGFFRKLLGWVIGGILLIIILDITHPGQSLVKFFANLFYRTGSWLVTVGIFAGALIIIVLGVIIYLEKRKKQL